MFSTSDNLCKYERFCTKDKVFSHALSVEALMDFSGEFIKHHGLQAHDRFIVYEDSCGNLVSSYL